MSEAIQAPTEFRLLNGADPVVVVVVVIVVDIIVFVVAVDDDDYDIINLFAIIITIAI